MLRKRLIAKLMVVSVLTLSMAEVVSAKVTDLARWTSSTYVTSEHDDFYFADTYIGTVSVKGTDRHYNGRYTEYPASSRITYNVQGDITRGEIFSEGSGDSLVRKKTITVRDKWNFGPVTTVVGSIGGQFFSNVGPYVLNEEGK
ncbi:MAG: hypothetical protein ACLRZ7_03695 [Lachnospiraceae bacterium]